MSQYQRRTSPVEARHITEENREEVSQWVRAFGRMPLAEQIQGGLCHHMWLVYEPSGRWLELYQPEEFKQVFEEVPQKMEQVTINVGKDFSPFPAGRLKSDGKFSGEAFRELLVSKLETSSTIVVELDVVTGYGSSFLEEAFGGLVSQNGYRASDLRQRISFVTTDSSLRIEILGYMLAAEK